MYRLDSNRALVQTVDFFTPIVDDPFVYGQIAAANALSDVYAMGGRPLTALAIAAFPKDAERTILQEIFAGGLDKLREAGVALLGGHTVQDSEIKFGYAITGEVDPARVLANAGAQPGDALLLTKPIGTGVIATALKFGRAPQEAIAAATRSMTTLNRAAAGVLERTAPGVGTRLHRHHRIRIDRTWVRNGCRERLLARVASPIPCRSSTEHESSCAATFPAAGARIGSTSQRVSAWRRVLTVLWSTFCTTLRRPADC